MSTPPPAPVLKEYIPQELHDRGYLKDFLDKPVDKDTIAALAKKLDGAETLIGRKTGVPAADAKPEEWEKFYGALRPEKADDYDYKFGEKADADFVKTFKESAHHAGMSKGMVNRLMEKLQPYFANRQKAAEEAAAAQDAEFTKLTASVDSAAMDKVKAALKEFVPDEAKLHIGSLDNKALALMALSINAILKKYANEDDLNPGGGAGGGGEDATALREEARKLMASPAYTDFRHPDHEKTKKRVDEIYAHPSIKK